LRFAGTLVLELWRGGDMAIGCLAKFRLADIAAQNASANAFLCVGVDRRIFRRVVGAFLADSSGVEAGKDDAGGTEGNDVGAFHGGLAGEPSGAHDV
jgi:hypothetical protein